MAQRHAELFRAIRPEVLARLVEVRGSIDQTFASMSPDVIGPQFDMVLDRMQAYLVTESPESYRNFASRWMAMRVSSGEPPQNLIHAMVSIGDVVTKIAQGRAAPGPEYQEFARAIARMTFVGSRMLVEQLSDELERRQQQLAAVRAGGGPR
jgi:hypothetical protein